MHKFIVCLPFLALLGCENSASIRTQAPDAEFPEPTLIRLTDTQYRYAIQDLFGSDIAVPSSLEPDVELDGLVEVGASTASISPLGIERFESAAYQIAEQVTETPGDSAVLSVCTPSSNSDAECFEQILKPLATRAWRRPPTHSELARLVEVGAAASFVLGDFYTGISYAIAAILQSPSFLYRVELGEPDPDHPERRILTDLELASRLSWFLWNGLPDDELLELASHKRLSRDDILSDQIDRMLDDPRASRGVRALFTDILGLHDVDQIRKDALVFPRYTSEFGALAREQTLRTIEHHVLDEDGDYRELLTSYRTFVDRTLASLYGIPAPTLEGFGEVILPEDGPRRGLLGQASILAMQAHPHASSVTRRGLYIRERLLCQPMPPPPAGVDTSIPESTDVAPTMRDRVAQHLSDPTCASCHRLTDPLGLALENFDSMGEFRAEDGGAPIDASGDLDGEDFTGPTELAQVLYAEPTLNDCLVETAYRYATAREIALGEEELVAWHTDGFTKNGHRVRWLMKDIAMSSGFRSVGEVTP